MGGKQGLLRLLVDRWVEAPVMAEGLERMPELADARAVLALLNSSVRAICQEHQQVIQLLQAAAPHDRTAAEGLATSADNIRRGLRRVADDIARRGELADGLDPARAADVLYYYFDWRSYLVLTGEGWTWDEAERWLHRCSASALLRAADPGPA